MIIGPQQRVLQTLYYTMPGFGCSYSACTTSTTLRAHPQIQIVLCYISNTHFAHHIINCAPQNLHSVMSNLANFITHVFPMHATSYTQRRNKT
jgi:hypothetical protein